MNHMEVCHLFFIFLLSCMDAVDSLCGGTAHRIEKK